jgi:hypothetical protein
MPAIVGGWLEAARDEASRPRPARVSIDQWIAARCAAWAA